MSEEIFKNEISVNELIEYIVDEVFPKFPEFCSLFESSDEIKRILGEKVTSIERRKTNNKDRMLNNSPAEYIPMHNKVILYSDEPVTIDIIKNSCKWRSIFTHEFVHAATNRTKSDKYYEVGCSYSGKRNKFIVLKELVLSFIFRPGKNMTKKTKEMFEMLKYMPSYNLGDALNEGLTTWITEKMAPYVEDDIGAYPWEKNFIESIEEVIGTNETLDLIKCDYKKIARKFGIPKLDSIQLIRYMDITNRLSDAVYSNDVKNPESYKKCVETYYSFGGIAQKIFIERIFLPKYFIKISKSIDDGEASVDDLVRLYNIMLRFRDYIYVEGFPVEDVLDLSSYQYLYEETFDNFEKFVKSVFIVFSDYVDTSKFTEEEIMNTKGIYDYVFKDAEEKSRINAEFYKLITDRAKKIELRQKMILAEKKSRIFVPGSPSVNGISFEDLAKEIVDKKRISTSDVALSRRERRAIERRNKKKQNKGDKNLNN